MNRSGFVSSAGALLVLCGAANGSILTFSGLEHGRIVTNQFAVSHGVTISAINPNRSHDIAAIFDSTETGTADPDLEGPPWAGGNLPSTTVMGNLLILSRNDTGAGDGILDNPDDEASRPAGDLIFEYSTVIDVFGFDIVDVDGSAELGSIEFLLGGSSVGLVEMADFVTNDGNPYYDATVQFGNNTINRLQPISASVLGSSFDTVVIHMGGSGAVDNVVPSPAGAALLAAGIGLGMARRRRA